MSHLYLIAAVIMEVVATNALKASEEFSKVLPSAIVFVGYSLSFYFLSLVLRTIPVGIAYAVWAGGGVALVSIISAVQYKQYPDTAAIIGMGLIVTGVAVINLFSKSTGH